MFTKLYSWCTSLGLKISEGGDVADYATYYSNYFNETPICTSIFWIGMAIATAIALFYYFGICNFVFQLAKRWIWLCVVAVVFVATLFSTIPTIVGHDADDPQNATGVFLSAYLTEEGLLNGTDDDNAREEIMQTASDFREQFLKKEKSTVMRESLPMEMGVANGCYAMVIFIVLSFAFKKHTKHGSSIPL